MSIETPVIVVTGANGYLGSRICSALKSQDWHLIKLGRSRQMGDKQALLYDLETPVTTQIREALSSADVLIHAAYDLSLTEAVDIWRVNVGGTRRLLEAAAEAGVPRMIVLSSMSAFDGTAQLYGRAKLDIEAMTAEFGGCSIRPGLVYGKQSGGMAGTLRKLTSLPFVPIIAGGAGVYTVNEEDFMRAIIALSSAAKLETTTISVAHPRRVKLVDLMRLFAAEEGRRCRFVPVPWRLVYWLLKCGESLRVHMPFRADSLLGIVYSSPEPLGADQLARLGVKVHEFPFKPEKIE